MSRRRHRHSGRLEVDGPVPPAFRPEDVHPTELDFDRRRMAAMDLRNQGHPLRVIGLKLHADPAMCTDDRWSGTGFRGGYGWKNYRQGKPPLRGNALELAVSRDVSSTAIRTRLALETVRQEALTLWLERMDVAAAAIWPRVLTGDPRAQEVWLRNMEDQADVLGIKPNAKVDVNVTGTITVEGAQPEFNAEFAMKMFEALAEVGALQPGEAEQLSLAVGTPPLDAIDTTAQEATEA